MKKIIYSGTWIVLVLMTTIARGSVPVAPLNLGIYNITDTTARLSFKDMSKDEIGFKVTHLQEKNQLLATVSSTDIYGSNKYQYLNLRKLKPLTLYTINIVAYNSEGESTTLQKTFRTLKSINNSVNQVPIVNAGEDKNLSLGKSIVIKGKAVDSDGLISSYLWKEGDEILANTASFTYTPTSKGMKKLTLTVTDDDGAKNIDTMLLLVIDGAMVSINDFGAIPNDNKDDTAAIQKALDVNGHIVMDRGIYNVHGIIRLAKETIIDGNASTFLSKLDTSNGGRTSKNILTLKGDKIIIKNLTLDGAYTNGNAKELSNVSSLLHIYDSKNILLENIDTVNYASNWWSSKTFSLSKLNSNHKKEMYHVIYIGFSKNITIQNMEQKGNLKTEGLLIYESDNIHIDGFKSFNSPKIWTSLHIVASDDIVLNHIEVGDGSKNQGGSSINFIANHNFIIKNTKTTTKQGFDISNEVRVKGFQGRVVRDTSNGTFENCYFEGQRALYGYPSINKNENIVFKNTQFIPTKKGLSSWGIRIQKAGNIRFEGCTIGSKKFKTLGIILGDGEEIRIKGCNFVNPSIGVYLFGKQFGKVTLEKNSFVGDNYSPVKLFWSKSYGGEGILNLFNLVQNKTTGALINNKFFIIKGDFKIKETVTK
jgi:hypothetical protein